MNIHAIITITTPASAAVHQERDDLIKAMQEFALPHGLQVRVCDALDRPVASRELEAGCAGAQGRLQAIAKKAGLTPKGRPDLGYGVHGGMTGPIEFWYQITATS